MTWASYMVFGEEKTVVLCHRRQMQIFGSETRDPREECAAEERDLDVKHVKPHGTKEEVEGH